MRVLQLSAPSRDDALDAVCDVLDEHSYFYSYFNVTRADQTEPCVSETQAVAPQRRSAPTA